MQDYLIALALTMMPAVGNFTGGILAEFFTVSPRLLNLALHLAAGIILAVVSIELMPQALQVDQSWIVILALVVGGCFAVLLDQVVGLVQRKQAGDTDRTKPWMIFLGTSIDLFTDGLIIGAGSTVNFGLGFPWRSDRYRLIFRRDLPPLQRSKRRISRGGDDCSYRHPLSCRSFWVRQLVSGLCAVNQIFSSLVCSHLRPVFSLPSPLKRWWCRPMSLYQKRDWKKGDWQQSH